MANLSRMGRLLQTTALVSAALAVAAPAFAQDDDEIIVTGSRIKRTDINAPSPVTSIGAQDLSLSNTVNSEQFLNSLPQLIPGLGGSSNNPGNGTATANLRGLGASRTLVLVDGHRYVASGLGGVVDLNSIPAALVKQIDVVTGGASAVYGSDAMAGVVNFILKDDFEGLEVGGTYEITEESDGRIFDMSVVAGGNFDGGRGNTTMFMSYTERDAVFQGDRAFSTVANDDNGTGFDPFGSSGVPGTRLFDGFDFTSIGYTTDGTTCTAPGGASSEGLSGTCTGGATFLDDGTPTPWINSGQNTTRYNYAPVNYLQLPQERFNISSFTRYDITDTLTFKLRGIFNTSTVPQELAPTPIFDTFTVDTANLTAQQAALINSTGNVNPDGTYDVFIGRRMLEVGPRNSNAQRSTFQLASGLEGQFNDNWSWDVYGHYAQLDGTEIQTGNVSRAAFQDALDSGACDIFGANRLSDDCVTQVARTAAAKTTVEQINLIATTAGTINGFSTPWSEDGMAVAAGVEYREENGNFLPDSVLGPDVAGFNSALPTSGGFTVSEVFVETELPLVQGADWAEELSVNAAFRYSDYSTAGGVESYSGGASWAPNSQIRFRAQYQRAVRAPSLVELFAPITNGFPSAVDPCAFGTGIQAICVREGVPAGSFGDNNLQPNSQIELLSGGNPNVSPETSDTITVGFVAQPAAIEGLTIQVDYYDIEIEDVIATVSAQRALDGCYINDESAFCSLINRASGSGQVRNISGQVENLAFLGVEGVDFQADYSWDANFMGASTFRVNYIGGIKLSDEFIALPGDPTFNCEGSFGGNGGECGEPIPEYKHTVRFDMVNGPFLTSLRWRHIGETKVDDFLPTNGNDGNDLFANTIDAYNFLDLSATYDVSEILQVSAGVSNLTGEEPPELGDCCSEQANTYPATYETLGRQFFVGAKAKF